MRSHRPAAALFVTIVVLLSAAPAPAAGSPPARLTTTSQLPRTGLDLLPEGIAGAVLFLAGLSLRLAPRSRRA